MRELAFRHLANLATVASLVFVGAIVAGLI
jgi:hypothetical protein